MLSKKINRKLRSIKKTYFNKKNVEKILDEKPKKLTNVAFEVTNKCNANCSFCTYRFMSRSKGIMDLNIYKKALKSCINYGIHGIALGTIVGDTLEDPFLLERIKLAKKLGEFKIISFYTNLIGINRFDIKEFLLSGITHITISTSFEGGEFYKKYFGIDKYHKVIDNIRNLCRLNISLGKPLNINIELRTPMISLLTIGRNRIYKEIYPMVNEIGIKYYYDDWFGLIKKKDIPQGCRFIRLNEINNRYKQKLPCRTLSGCNLMIMLDGKVNICGCRNFNADKELIIGDIKENTLKDIWLGNKIKKLREDWLEGKIPEICEKCQAYMSVLNDDIV